MDVKYSVCRVVLLLLAVTCTHQSWVVPKPQPNLARNQRVTHESFDDDMARKVVDGTTFTDLFGSAGGRTEYYWIDLGMSHTLRQIRLYCELSPSLLQIFTSVQSSPVSPTTSTPTGWTKQNSTWRFPGYSGLLPLMLMRRYVIDWSSVISARHVAVFSSPDTLTEVEIYGSAPGYNIAPGKTFLQSPMARVGIMNGTRTTLPTPPALINSSFMVFFSETYKIGAVRVHMNESSKNIIVAYSITGNVAGVSSASWINMDTFEKEGVLTVTQTVMAKSIAIFAEQSLHKSGVQEIEIYTSYNLAYGRPAAQGPDINSSAHLAVNGIYSDFSSVGPDDSVKWWQVNLESEFSLSNVTFYKRSDVVLILRRITLFTSSAVSPTNLSVSYEGWTNRSYREPTYAAVGVVNFASPIEAQHVAIVSENMANFLSLQEVVIHEYNYALFKGLYEQRRSSAHPGNLAVDGNLQTYSVFEHPSNTTDITIDLGRLMVMGSIVFYFNNQYCPRTGSIDRPRCAQVVGNLIVHTSAKPPRGNGVLIDSEECSKDNKVITDSVIIECDSTGYIMPVTRSINIVFDDLASYRKVEVQEIEVYGKELPRLTVNSMDWQIDYTSSTSLSVSFKQWSQEDIGSYPPSDYTIELEQTSDIKTIYSHNLVAGERVVADWRNLNLANNYSFAVGVWVNSILSDILKFSTCTNPVAKFTKGNIFDQQGWLTAGLNLSLTTESNCPGDIHHNVSIVDSSGSVVYSQTGTTSSYLLINNTMEDVEYTITVTAWNAQNLSSIILETGNLPKQTDTYSRTCRAGTFDHATQRNSSAREFRVGTKLYYDCNVGYKKVGEDFVKCRYNKKLEPKYRVQGNITCKVMTCPTPLNGTNTEAVIDPVVQKTYNEQYTYSCLTGYTSVDLTVTCTGNGNWSAIPVCRGVECPPPPEGTNTETVMRLATPKTYNEQYTYSCLTGYKPSVNLTVTCTENGIWSATPVCGAVECPAPPEGTNTETVMPLATPKTYNEQYTYSCLPGYRPSDGLTVTCTENGNWSATPVCSAAPCPTPPEGTNTEAVIPPDVQKTYNEQYTYSCLTGYTTSDELTVTCQANRQWTEPPTCTIQQCPPLLDGVNTISVDPSTNREYLQQYTYTCVNGYKIGGNVTFTVRCEADGEWSALPPTCQIVECPTPPSGTNTEAVIPPDVQKTYNEQYTYSCLTGYATTNQRTVTCTSQGEWSHSPPTCTIVTCPTPIEGVHTVAVDPSGRWQYNDKYTYTCKEGYQPQRGITITCLESGRWHPTVTVCEEKSCQPPPNGINTEPVLNLPFLATNTYTYACIKGYRAQGNLTLKCDLDGTWSPPTAPTCIVIRCQPPPNGNNTIRVSPSLESVGVSGTFTYRCAEGYRIQGIATITCLASGAWSSSTPPTCSEIRCSSPANGPTTVSVPPGLSVKPSETYTYSCKDGYKAQGSLVVTCTISGWSPAAPPSCVEVICTSPPEGLNTATVEPGLQKLLYERYTYTCKDGYKAITGLTLTCQSGGGWLPPPPVTCLGNCTVQPISNAKQVSKLNKNMAAYLERIKYKCDDGFANQGNDTFLTCAHDGKGKTIWKGNFTCKEKLSKKKNGGTIAAIVIVVLLFICAVVVLGIIFKRLTGGGGYGRVAHFNVHGLRGIFDNKEPNAEPVELKSIEKNRAQLSEKNTDGQKVEQAADVIGQSKKGSSELPRPEQRSGGIEGLNSHNMLKRHAHSLQHDRILSEKVQANEEMGKYEDDLNNIKKSSVVLEELEKRKPKSKDGHQSGTTVVQVEPKRLFF